MGKEGWLSEFDRIKQPGPEDPILFYPPEFAPLDNFSAFQIEYDRFLWPTSEHAYQAAKFKNVAPEIVDLIKNARSAHAAQKIAGKYQALQISDWDHQKIEIMKQILRCKVDQHPYVLKKLLETGDREIIEDSWRDSVWGWGKDKTGQNLLGHIWMDLRKEYKRTSAP